MDADRFDCLARGVHADRSRREAFRLLAGGALAGAVALLGGEQATAKCARTRRCGKGNCCPKGDICADKASQTCVTGKGTCQAGDDWCDDQTKTCNGSDQCICQTTIEGKLRCTALLPLAGCCENDASCVTQNNVPGAVCVVRSHGTCGGGCANNVSAKGSCFAPCPQE